MQVRDHQPSAWFLFEHQGQLLLDVNCSYSFFGYAYTIILNNHERQAYAQRGRAYLSELAVAIQNSHPIQKDSTSKYAGRDVSTLYANETVAAVQAWRTENKTP